MKKTKGITLISLVITIVILVILCSIITYSGTEVIKSSKWTKFTTQLKIMQTQVDTIYEKNKEATYGQEIVGEIKTQADKIFEELVQDPKSGITSANQEGYRYWNEEEIENLGIEDIEQDFLINLKERIVISYEGFEYEGKTYYTLNQIPNGLYNVNYSKPNVGKPIFTISKEEINNNKWKIFISDIVYNEGYINKWQVEYQQVNKEYWNRSEDMSFVVTSPGKYNIILSNDEIKSDTQIIRVGSWWDEEVKVNTPDLKDGMTAIYFDEAGNETEISSDDSEEKWYKYVEGDNETSTNSSKWANVKTSDGRYLVWIPRYEYKKVNEEAIEEQKYEIKFIPVDKTVADEGYEIPKAFTDEESTKKGELAGIWISKDEINDICDIL